MRSASIFSATALVLFPVAALAIDPVTSLQPSNGINYVIQTAGANADTFGEIDMLPYTNLPDGLVEADGTSLAVSPANQTLFNQIGNAFGGDGVSTFQLPDLNGSTPIGTGQGDGLTNRNLGDQTGADQENVTQANLPVVYNGQALPLNIMQPSLSLNYMIATQGVFPSRNAAGLPPGINAQFTGGSNPVVSPAIGNNSGPIIGQVIITAGNTAPAGFLPCDGQILSINDDLALYFLLGTTYGGDGMTTFALPDLRGRAVVSVGGLNGFGAGLSESFLGERTGSEATPLFTSNLPVPQGSDQPYNNIQPTAGLNYIIALEGIFPTPGTGDLEDQDILIGQIALFAGDFAPQGWAFCEGQLLSIAQNTALSSLLGTTYGGNGVTTFALPDLEGRVAVGNDNGVGLNGLTPFSLGEKVGVETVTLTGNETPALPEPTSLASLALGAFALIPRRRAPSGSRSQSARARLIRFPKERKTSHTF